jgi:hypothetical protein
MNEFVLTPGSLAVLLTVLLIPKMAQEYMLHYQEVKPWGWIKDNVLQLGCAVRTPRLS